MQDSTLVLRDIHPGTAPAWWPPAPGWWLVVALVLAAVAAYALWRSRKRARMRRIVELFDGAVDTASGAPAKVAAMSELLRRAGHLRNPQADKLPGDSWLAFLDDGDADRPFVRGPGRLLLEGGYRREVDPQQLAALQTVVRRRFLAWMVK